MDKSISLLMRTQAIEVPTFNPLMAPVNAEWRDHVDGYVLVKHDALNFHRQNFDVIFGL